MDDPNKLVQHICLPPQLPQGLDEGAEGEVERGIGRFFTNAAKEFRTLLDTSSNDASSSAHSILARLLARHDETHSGDGVNASKLQSALTNMDAGGHLSTFPSLQETR